MTSALVTSKLLTAPPPRRLLFWCSKPLGARCLSYAARFISLGHPEYQIVGVVISAQDKTRVRLEQIAAKYNFPVLAPESELPPADVGLSIGFLHKIPQSNLELCRLGAINLHFAPLPYYRGSGCLTQALLAGDTRFGVSLHYMDGQLDTGPIIDVAWMQLDQHETAGQIIKRLEKLAFKLFKKWWWRVLNYHLPAVPQPYLCHHLKIKPIFSTRQMVKNLLQLPLGGTFADLYHLVRALDRGKNKRPYFYDGERKIYLSLTP